MGITSRDIDPKRGIDASLIRGAFNSNPWTRTLYVDSSHLRAIDEGNSGLDRYAPLATLVQAIAQAQVGDLIILGAGHAETVSTAAALDVSVAGLQIVGPTGQGLRRPTFTMDSVVGAVFTISASGVRIHNVHFKPGIDSLTKLVNITANNVELHQCMISHDATYQALVGILLAANVDYCRITGLLADQEAAAATACIQCADSLHLEILDCRIVGDYSVACISASAAVERVLIARNFLESLNGTDCGIDLFAASTGDVAENRIRIATDVQTTWIKNAGAVSLYENYGVNDDGETGKLIGTASA